MKIAIVGVGNCASSLAQALQFASKRELELVSLLDGLPALDPSDMSVVAAFDVNARKVGRELAEAISAEPNCTTLYTQPEPTGVVVSPGVLADGLDGPLKDLIPVSPMVEKANLHSVAAVLRGSGAEIVVLYLPVGSQRASEVYAEAALEAGCALVNCTPAVLATSPVWCSRFRERGLPLVGDDMKSCLGSTTVHTALLELMKRRGIQVESTYQLNIGGNADFLNMRDPDRAAAKRKTKVAALRRVSELNGDLGIGPSDFVPHLRDHKVGYIRIEGRGFLGMPVSLEVQLRVEDSPNAASITLDAVRLAAALRARVVVDEFSACRALFKHPKAAEQGAERHAGGGAQYAEL